jgi:AAA15 family ATPase/GTPase
MLLEFQVENDGAFASSSEISLVASKLKDADQGAVREIGDAAKTKVLTSALILGKNGSGKSTLINCMTFVSGFVKDSARDSEIDSEIGYDPNILLTDYANKPTTYRVLFSVDSAIYEFEFSNNKDRVLTEFLSIADRSTRFRKLYSREWSEKYECYDYSYGDALAGPRLVWQQSTRDNALYLSTAALLKSDSLTVPYGWLSNFVRTTSIGPGLNDYTAKRCMNDDSFKKKVVCFLQAMDINVTDIEIEEEDLDQKFLEQTFTAEFINKIFLKDGKTTEKKLTVRFVKRTDDGKSKSLRLNQESTGTQALFSLAGPLFDTLEKGYCLIIDEINTSLHPVITHFLVSLFSKDYINARKAQLIFTSHDVSVLREGILRRDQVWLIENNGISASLIPLSDYSPRKGEALEKGYLAGRYGGIPALLPSLFELGHAEKI